MTEPRPAIISEPVESPPADAEARPIPAPAAATLWNRALSQRAAGEAAWLLGGCMLVMFGFHWLYIYLTSFVRVSSFAGLFDRLPETAEGMLGISIADAARPRGRLGLAYVDPIVVVISAVWALARGSDAVSGPLDRGTLELVLAQPINRVSVLLANAGVTVAGAAALALAAWLGTCVGIATVSFNDNTWFITRSVPLTKLVDFRDFIPSAVNLFSLTVLAAGLTTLISACDRYRWRTLGIAGGFYLVEILLKMAGLATTHLKWLFYLTFLGAYWPQALALETDHVWAMSLWYDGPLVAGGAICYLAAAVVFDRRDLPAPL